MLRDVTNTSSFLTGQNGDVYLRFLLAYIPTRGDRFESIGASVHNKRQTQLIAGRPVQLMYARIGHRFGSGTLRRFLEARTPRGWLRDHHAHYMRRAFKCVSPT